MTTAERKILIVNAIRKLEQELCILKYAHEYDGVRSLTERDTDIEILQHHLHSAHGALLLLAEEELRQVA